VAPFRLTNPRETPNTGLDRLYRQTFRVLRSNVPKQSLSGKESDLAMTTRRWAWKQPSFEESVIVPGVVTKNLPRLTERPHRGRPQASELALKKAP